jgi:O-antigen/teichoic acid export membrane protein
MFTNRRTTGLGHKIVRNVLFSGGRLLLLAPLPFLLVPYLLKKLGNSGYGTLAVFLAVSGITSIADFGLVTTLSKHVAEFYALKDFRGLSRIANTGFLVYTSIAAMIAGVLWAASRFLISVLFRGSTLSSNELHHLWSYLIVMIVANAMTLLFSSVTVGLQRMDLSTTLTSMNVLLSAVLAIMFLHWNGGLQGVVHAYTLAACITGLSYTLLLRRILPEIKPRFSDCHWSVAKEIFGFSTQTYMTQVAVAIHNQIEKMYLARFTGVVAAGGYDIASSLALKLRAVPGLVLAPVMPAASELNALDSQSKLADLYFRSHKYLACIGIPFVTYAVFISKPFVRLWIGPDLIFVAVPLSVLLIVNFLNLLTGPGLLIFIGIGKLKPGLYSAVLGIVINVSLSFFLIRAYGFGGAVIGTSVSLLLASLFFVCQFWRETGNLFAGMMRRAYLKPGVCSALTLVPLWLLTSRMTISWGGMVFAGLVFLVIYASLLLLVGFFDTFDLAVAERFVPIPIMARRLIPDA